MSEALVDRWMALARRSLAGEILSRDAARAVINAPDDELPALVSAVWGVRNHFWGRRMRLHVLENAKSGKCPEDCGFCSQSKHYDTPVEEYALKTVEEIVAGARRAKQAKAWKYCIVTATRGPSRRDLDTVCEATKQIKAEMDIKICASLGVLTPEKATRLKEAGVDRFNHNLETSERYYEEIVTTHEWKDRVATVKIARDAGMEVCSGGIVGMGETEDDLLDLAFSLRELNVESLPVNFLDPRPGTPMGIRLGADARQGLTPARCLKVLCMFRFVHPTADLRVAGGREVHLRWMTPMALYVVNSMFTAGYLTTPGAAPSADHQMILDMGFQIEEVQATARDSEARYPAQAAAQPTRVSLPVVSPDVPLAAGKQVNTPRTVA